ncbi:hypothetical protein [Chitinophaga sp. HK235]|uniref:hypothetical protein n=1 Tax=Chitinophaga sp. HK235 TaxID=2952571 RepID=UPI001BAA0BD1|nr:hypothetical protein [Chitinophaga sp. HK235]
MPNKLTNILNTTFIVIMFFALQGRAIERYATWFSKKTVITTSQQVDTKVKSVYYRCKLQCFSEKIVPLALPPEAAAVPALHTTPREKKTGAITVVCYAMPGLLLLPLRAPPIA